MQEVKEKEVVETTSPFLPIGYTIGDRIVRLKFIEKFSMLPKDKAIRAEVVKKVGSSWKKGTKDIIRGLDRHAIYLNDKGEELIVDEEKKYLPNIVGTSADSDKFEAMAKEHWANFTLECPAGDKGVELNVGFTRFAEPINVDDYIKYKMCLQHPHVAVTEDELENMHNDVFELYIVDTKKERMKELDNFDMLNEASTNYVRIINGKSPELTAKLDYILELEGGENGAGISVVNMSDKEKFFELKKFVDSKPAKFLQLIADSHLQTKALIRKCVQYRHITKEGDSFFYLDKPIGSSLLEAVAYLDNPVNSDTRLKLSARLQASTK